MPPPFLHEPYPELSPSEHSVLRIIAALFARMPSVPLKAVHREGFLAAVGLSPVQGSIVTRLLDGIRPTTLADLDQQLFAPPALCPIPWRPTIFTPVFWGRQHFEPDSELRVPATVYYPSLDGTVSNAPILANCGHYPLILFLHGHCPEELNHVYRWERMLSQLARCGFVVVAPFLPSIGSGPGDPNAFADAVNALRWVRKHWSERAHVLPPPATGVVGHSYGAMVAYRVATLDPVSAYASLSARWSSWDFSIGEPLAGLSGPSLHAWGTSGIGSDELEPQFWNDLPRPKHRLVLHGGEHFVYLQGQNGGCSPQNSGECNLLGAIAGDLVAGFFSKYLPPSESALVGNAIPHSLVAPDVELTVQQAFYAGAHLFGLKMLPFSNACSVTSTWETASGSGSSTLGES